MRALNLSNVQLEKVFDQFKKDQSKLKSEELETLLAKKKITKQQLLNCLEWDAGADIDGIEDGKIVGDTIVFGFTTKDAEYGLDYDNFEYMSVPFSFEIKLNKFIIKFDTSNFNNDEKRIWKFAAEDIKQKQEQNIRENFPELVEELKSQINRLK